MNKNQQAYYKINKIKYALKDFNFIQTQFNFKTNIKTQMRVTSPFLQLIPECKKNMRKLRKKIYKYITSKKHSKKIPESRKDLLSILKDREVPSFIIETLNKKKSLDLNTIRSFTISSKIPLIDLQSFTIKQQTSVSQVYKQWKIDCQIKQIYRQSREYRIEQNSGQSSIVGQDSQSKYFAKTNGHSDQQNQEINRSFTIMPCHQQYNDFQSSMNKGLEYSSLLHGINGNNYLQMESSILSQNNLFKKFQ